MDRLTLDCIAAQKAGMTYGKWKALHPHTSEAVATKTPTKCARLCSVCGMEIPSSYHGKLYCGEECAYEAKLARTREYNLRRKERMMANGNV